MCSACNLSYYILHNVQYKVANASPWKIWLFAFQTKIRRKFEGFLKVVNEMHIQMKQRV